PRRSTRASTSTPSSCLGWATPATAPTGRSRSALLRSGRVFLAQRREDVEIEHRLLADHLAPMLDVGRNVQQAAGAKQVALPVHVEADLAGEDVDDLLVAVAVRPRLVAGHETVQRHGRAIAGEGLALDALAHRRPRNGAPVDLVHIHIGLL